MPNRKTWHHSFLFNDEKRFAPAGPCLADTALHNASSGAALFAAIGEHYATMAQAVFELLDNAIAGTLAVIDVRATGERIRRKRLEHDISIPELQEFFRFRTVQAI